MKSYIAPVSIVPANPIVSVYAFHKPGSRRTAYGGTADNVGGRSAGGRWAGGEDKSKDCWADQWQVTDNNTLVKVHRSHLLCQSRLNLGFYHVHFGLF